MARYYFNVLRNNQTFEDDEGTDHLTTHSAWEEATQACGEMMRDLDGDLKPGEEWRMEVLNEKKDLVFVLKFSAQTGPGYTKSGPP